MIALIAILLILVVTSSGWRAWRRLRFFLHMYQLEGYKTSEFIMWTRRRGRTLLVMPSHIAGVLLVWAAVGVLFVVEGVAWIPVYLFLWLVTFASAHAYDRRQTKKPLKYTPRLKRLLGAALFIGLLPFMVAAVIYVHASLAYAAIVITCGLWFLDAGAPLWVIIAGFVMKPVERSIQRGFKRQARERLKERRDLTTVAITGSYGKTSVKFILKDLLGVRYNVLATPSSYNTPMGICLVVNNRLRPEHQVLVLEMGARYTGDIAELCRLAPPDIAVVTSVGKAHLETMGPIENIARVKGEILRGLKPSGIAVLNADDPRVMAMADTAPGKIWRVSVEGHGDLAAFDIRYGPEGARFKVRDGDGQEQEMRTRLLGSHNILNILLALAVGRELGLRLRQMAHAVAALKPVQHRLELKRQGDITVIDDAFNSNPVGARNAVNILSRFDTGRRIIVTPGMIELGAEQESENEALGAFMADKLDLAVLVGARQTEPIRRGLKKAGFPKDQLKVFASLSEAQHFLGTYLRAGDVVLYENDLPDQYNE